MVELAASTVRLDEYELAAICQLVSRLGERSCGAIEKRLETGNRLGRKQLPALRLARTGGPQQRRFFLR